MQMETLVPTRMYCYPGFPWTSLLTGDPGRTKDICVPKGSILFLRGRTALWNGIKLLGLKPGDNFLFPAYHCGSELDVLVAAGLDVGFYRVDRKCKIDLDELCRLATAKTRGLYLIHYFGFPQPLAEIVQLCKNQGWHLIEDCAQALFVRAQGMPVGTAGDVGIFSIHKFLPIPCCGTLSINNIGLRPASMRKRRPPSLYVLRQAIDLFGRDLTTLAFMNHPMTLRLRAILSKWIARTIISGSEKQGKDASWKPRAFITEWRSSDAPWLSRKLLPATLSACDIVLRRRENFDSLLRACNDRRRIHPLIEMLEEGACPLYFPVVVPENVAGFMDFCHERGVMAHSVWRRSHPKLPRELFPEAAWLREHVVALPVHQGLRLEEIEYLQALIADWEHERG